MSILPICVFCVKFRIKRAIFNLSPPAITARQLPYVRLFEGHTAGKKRKLSYSAKIEKGIHARILRHIEKLLLDAQKLIVLGNPVAAAGASLLICPALRTKAGSAMAVSSVSLISLIHFPSHSLSIPQSSASRIRARSWVTAS